MTYKVLFANGHEALIEAASIHEVELAFEAYPVTTITPVYTTQATGLNPLWLLAIAAWLLWFGTRK
jgi:hypothetical protein